MIQLSAENQKWTDEIWSKIEKKLSVTAEEVRDFIPYTTENGKYVSKHISWWTNGFHGGLMWLMYNATGKEAYKQTAIRQEELLDEAFKEGIELHHDVGFMWNLVSKPHYLFDGNTASKSRTMLAANLLAGRLNIKGGYISAWPHKPGYTIIDCMMNLPILYWLSKEINDDRFKYIAELHADMTAKCHIRDDGSVAHITNHATDHNEFLGEIPGQGYSDNSAWSRGQAWAIYGFLLSYINTDNQDYLDISKKTADYFIKEAEKSNWKILTDFLAPKEPVYFDNSAAACAACGMIELYKIIKEEKYLEAAINILKALEEDCIFDDSDQSILQNCMVSYSNGEECHLIYGDFFLTEAVMKLKNYEFLIW